jgi:hypothetical protein
MQLVRSANACIERAAASALAERPPSPPAANRSGRFTSPRGDLLCELRGDRVVIAGHVVEYLRGEIETEVPAS